MSGSVRCLQPGGGATAAAAAEQTLVSERTERSQRHVHIAEVVASATSSGSSVNELASGSSSCSEAHRSDSPPPDSRVTAARRTTRNRTISGSKSEDHLMTTESGRFVSFHVDSSQPSARSARSDDRAFLQRVYTKGRPPWYDRAGRTLKEPYVIGICGGSASGKTTVAKRIIERLEMPWVTVLSMDSFYKVLNREQHEMATRNEYNFDHPDAFDFQLMCETLRRLRTGKSVEVPVYDFTVHRRDKQPKIMYGADVLIVEGILAFHNPEIVDLMDIKIFVDTDSDTRLARRLERDIAERGRDMSGVLQQYIKHVKPAFDSFIAPGMKQADIIVPRGGENEVAIDLIVKQVKTQLADRGYDANKYTQQRMQLANANSVPHAQLPETLSIVKQTPQVLGLHTFIRNRETPRDEFIFYSERLMRILIEDAINYMPFVTVEVESPSSNGVKYEGRMNTCRDKICGVSILRAGETMENALRGVVKDCKMGKILIQTNQETMGPELYYLRLPKDVHQYRVLLMDATVATGAAALMAIRVLLDHDVPEENIMLLSLLMAETGVHSVAYAFPKVRLLTTAVDRELSPQFHVVPGVGNFGDRYYGTEIGVAANYSSSDLDDDDDDDDDDVDSSD